ncbi:MULTISPECIES: restriction endonuclease subunit S [Bacillus]|uniref:restriction endonuclease subunit S n=1 Tax=Bacillus TaxID=1386 RepID=UPI0010638D0B|nr:MULTISPECIES: restriction endonuclease subunit S [Bacillus]NYS75867.1 restriction endonuclease subunit S [Bacillus sp. BH32]TKH62588.1 restriction endonuclease subunit S [Bacillus cereus]
MSFKDEIQVYELGEVTINHNNLRVPLSGKQRLQRQGRFPYYGAQGVIDYIDEYIFKGEYLLIAEDGANLDTRKEDIARLTKKGEKFWVNNHAHIITANDKSDIRYLKFLLNKIDISGYITGSAQPKLNKANLNSIKVYLPPLEKQKAIANILSSFDEKIETNNQINKKLEEMAQMIFKQWFVDFEFPNEDGEPYKSSGGEMVESELGMVPEGWAVEELVNISYINPKETLKKGQESIFVEMANLPQNSARVSDFVIKEYSGGTKFRNGDILFARITPCLENGKTAIVDFLSDNQVGFGSTEYIILRPNILSTYYLYFLARDNDFRSNAIKNMNGSSGRQRVDVTFIKQYKVVCPSKDYLERFAKLCRPLFESMKCNDEESKALSITRDTLRPKLMSGEICVPVE